MLEDPIAAIASSRLFPSPPGSGARVAALLSLCPPPVSASQAVTRQASRCPVRCNRDAPVWVRSVSASRAGLGASGPCRAVRGSDSCADLGHESVSSQTQARPSVSDRTSHTCTGERARPPYTEIIGILPLRNVGFVCLPSRKKDSLTRHLRWNVL